MFAEFSAGRGHPWEFDPGPPRNRRWPWLFAKTPNYRGLGVAASGQEEFRWHQGPMFYRGRLRDGQVKVLVIGQEGAQDESLSHRSFTGGTGARMQYFLNHLGITRSYLFLNTFVYPIFDQYDGVLPKLAQHPDSPIAKHRNEIFDYVVARNEVHLVVAVGKAAKESVVSWVESHDGSADPDQLHTADLSVISPSLRAVGVLHPGGASRGGKLTNIINAFKAAISQVETWAAQEPAWLLPDDDGERLPSADYKYRSAPIPFRDFAYGTPWRLGRGGTSSNRRDGQEAIQLYSADGEYNQRSGLTYLEAVGDDQASYGGASSDLPWEPGRDQPRDFDRGPSSSMARLLLGGNPRFPLPDFGAHGVSGHASFGHGPSYRGQLRRPSLLVLADQQSHDDLFTGRALTGEPGQHLQAWLRAAGVTERYCILRVVPVDTMAMSPAAHQSLLGDPMLIAQQREVVRRIRPQVVATLGVGAERIAAEVVDQAIPTVALASHGTTDWMANWHAGLSDLAGLTYEADIDPMLHYAGASEQIPRRDLPFGTLQWQASSGQRVVQATHKRQPSPDYFKVRMPQWVDRLPPPPLTVRETRALDRVFGRATDPAMETTTEAHA